MTSEMEYLREAVEELTKRAKRAEADRDEWRMKAKVNAEAADRLGRMLEAAEAERDALSARLQAVRDWATADHGGVKRPIDIWPGLAAALAPLDASLGTPGDEKARADVPCTGSCVRGDCDCPLAEPEPGNDEAPECEPR